MKPNLDAIPYKHRFNGASLLISKANRLADLGDTKAKVSPKNLLAAVAYYDMALALTKPFDPNYATAINWKCNALVELGQYEEAGEWYREIVRISDEVDGQAKRNPTAALAEEMIQRYAGRPNEPLEIWEDDTTTFDDPPFCMFAAEFCALLSEKKFKQAHRYLAAPLQESMSVAELKAAWLEMTGAGDAADIAITLEQSLTDWPARKPDDVGWCYFSVAGEEFSEAVSLVVTRMPENWDRITELEFGRP